MISRIIVLIAFLAVAAQAQIRLPGGCPSPTSQKNIDVNKILGTWYEQYKWDYDFFSERFCGSLKLELNGTSIKATFTQINKATGLEISQVATGTFNSTLGTLTLDFSFGRLTYTILKTDQATYMVVFDCLNLPFWQSNRNTVIWTREKFPSANSLVPAFNGYKNATFNVLTLRNTDQYRCPLPREQ